MSCKLEDIIKDIHNLTINECIIAMIEKFTHFKEWPDYLYENDIEKAKEIIDALSFIARTARQYKEYLFRKGLTLYDGEDKVFITFEWKFCSHTIEVFKDNPSDNINYTVMEALEDIYSEAIEASNKLEEAIYQASKKLENKRRYEERKERLKKEKEEIERVKREKEEAEKNRIKTEEEIRVQKIIEKCRNEASVENFTAWDDYAVIDKDFESICDDYSMTLNEFCRKVEKKGYIEMY